MGKYIFKILSQPFLPRFKCFIIILSLLQVILSISLIAIGLWWDTTWSTKDALYEIQTTGEKELHIPPGILAWAAAGMLLSGTIGISTSCIKRKPLVIFFHAANIVAIIFAAYMAIASELKWKEVVPLHKAFVHGLCFTERKRQQCSCNIISQSGISRTAIVKGTSCNTIAKMYTQIKVRTVLAAVGTVWSFVFAVACCCVAARSRKEIKALSLKSTARKYFALASRKK